MPVASIPVCRRGKLIHDSEHLRYSPLKTSFNLSRKPLRLRKVVAVGTIVLGELLEQLLLTVGQLFGDLDQDLNQLVAGAMAANVGQALALELEHFAVLGAAGDIELLAPLERGHFDLAAERAWANDTGTWQTRSLLWRVKIGCGLIAM